MITTAKRYSAVHTDDIAERCRNYLASSGRRTDARVILDRAPSTVVLYLQALPVVAGLIGPTDDIRTVIGVFERLSIEVETIIAALGINAEPVNTARRSLGLLDLATVSAAAETVRKAAIRIQALELRRVALASPPTTVDGAAVIDDQTCSHADDFSTVVWFGTRYAFKGDFQRQIVELLWTDFETNAGAGLRNLTIGEKVGSDNDRFRVETIFRSHPALHVMIGRVGRGAWALIQPR